MAARCAVMRCSMLTVDAFESSMGHLVSSQDRKAAGCAASYVGMSFNDCNDIRTHLYPKTNTTDTLSSIVWLIQPVYPQRPIITDAELPANTLIMTVQPSNVTGIVGAWRLPTVTAFEPASPFPPTPTRLKGLSSSHPPLAPRNSPLKHCPNNNHHLQPLPIIPLIVFQTVADKI